MNVPPGWTNPIVEVGGQTQKSIDPNRLLPSRRDLTRTRIETQRSLVRSGTARFTPILVNPQGVILDGHHGTRAAAEEGRLADAMIREDPAVSSGPMILDLPTR